MSGSEFCGLIARLDSKVSKILPNDQISEYTGIYTNCKKTLAQVQLWDAKSLLRVVM